MKGPSADNDDVSGTVDRRFKVSREGEIAMTQSREMGLSFVFE